MLHQIKNTNNMKHLFILLISSFAFGSAVAQQVEPLPNGNFEQWDSIDGYANPRNWYTLNELIVFGFQATTEMTTDAHSGSYAAKLESKDGQSADLSGVICTGPILNASGQPDFSHMKIAFNKRPSALRFFYKTTFNLPDTAVLGYFLTKWNATTQQTDTIGMAQAELFGTFSTYQQAVINFEYFSNATPDSAFFIASSSIDGFNPTVGSTLYLDDMDLLYYAAGVNETTANLNRLTVWPNPTNATIHVSAGEKILNVSIFDMEGKLVYEAKHNDTQYQADLSNLKEGLYILQTEHASSINRTKILVK